MSQDFIVPNSEAGEEEVLIPLQSDTDELHISTDESPPQTEQKVAHSTVPDIHQYSNNIRRALRKRKAIQKMPYSLDRIRHRQLLQGYDVSNFDDAMETINLPERSHVGEQIENHDCENYRLTPSQTSDSYQQEELPAAPKVGGRFRHIFIPDVEEEAEEWAEDATSGQFNQNELGSGSDDDDDISAMSRSSVSYDEKVLFRGREINLKTGYKGVLPKTAWNKAITEETKRKNDVARRRIFNNSNASISNNGKGVAKRTIRHRQPTSKDDTLAYELVDSNDEEETESIGNYLHLNFEEQMKESSKLDEYFLRRYEPENNTSASTDDEDSIAELTHRDLGLLTLDEVDKTALEEIIVNNEPGTRGPSASGLKSGIFDFMLSNRNPNSAESHGNKRMSHSRAKKIRGTNESVKRYRYHPSSKKHNVLSMMKPNVAPKDRATGSDRGLVRKSIEQDVRGFSLVKEPQYNRETKAKVSRKGLLGTTCDVSDKKARTKKRLFTVAPLSNSELNRKALTFSTVIEEPSNRFFVRHVYPISALSTKRHVVSKENVDTTLTVIDQELLRSIAESRAFASPDIVTLTINRRQFSISKLGKDPEEAISQLFHELVQFGGSDTEVKKLAASLSKLLFSWPSSSIYDIIDSFHHEFRAKVNSFRNRSKPIHFFFIAVFQLLFLEVSRYPTTSLSIKTNLAEKITDHVVSFFKLYVRCDVSDRFPRDPLIKEALYILSFVVDMIRGTDLLWNKLGQNKVSPEIACQLINTFPTTKSSWSVTKVKQNFDDAVLWIKFIGVCSNEPYDWEITNELALEMYAFFKKRRFEDFPEEAPRKSLGVVPLPENDPHETIFNTFISILETCEFGTSILEKLTPMSRVHDLRSASLFVNRLNLLLTLASQSTYSYEHHFEKLLEQYILRKDLIIQEGIFRAMLSGVISFLRISYRKSYTVRCNILPLLWRKLNTYKTPSYEQIWNGFWNNLKALMPLLKRSTVPLLKSLEQILHHILNSTKATVQGKSLLDIFVDNLESLDAAWIQGHIFQVIVSKAKNSLTYLHYYCIIAKYLIDQQVLNWWSMLHYNTFDDDKKIAVHYYTFLASECDELTFSEMKLAVYRKILAYLLRDCDQYLINLINIMARRDSKLHLKIRQTTLSSSNISALIQCLHAFHLAKYFTLFPSFLDDLKTVYFSDATALSPLKNVVLFLNHNMIDTVRLYPVFIHLRSVFGIDDEETENSVLRSYLKNLSQDSERLQYLMNRTVSTLENGMSITSLLETLKKTITNKCFNNDIAALSTVIIQIPFEDKAFISEPLLVIFTVFLTLLNDRLEVSTPKLSASTSKLLMNTGHYVSILSARFRKSQISDRLTAPLGQCYRLFYNLLRVSFGFSDHQRIRTFLRSLSSLSTVLTDTPSLSGVREQFNMHPVITIVFENYPLPHLDLSAALSDEIWNPSNVDYHALIEKEFS